METQKAFNKLLSIQQQHLLQFWGTLNEKERAQLIHQIDEIDVAQFKLQQALLQEPQISYTGHLEPVTNVSISGNKQDQELGRQLISEGEVACIILAGGQGTRLKTTIPKGMVPVSVVKNKTLFQLFAEKTVAAGKQANIDLHLAIMTSPLNHEETVRYFEQNKLFGMNPENLSFFMQRMLPFLNQEGNLFLENKETIAQGPDGNGFVLKYLVESGIWDKWQKAGIRYINLVLIDNPLADPFDAELFGYHHRNGADITVKCIKREDPQEKVGLIVRKKDHLAVLEYTEIAEEERSARLSNGMLKHSFANISLFCFRMDFIQRLMETGFQLPLHRNFKSAKYVTPSGESLVSKDPIAWKFEAFIFDLLLKTQKVQLLLYPRERCFAPLKNENGPNSLEAVKAALQNEDIRIAQELFGKTPEIPFELDQELHYPKR